MGGTCIYVQNNLNTVNIMLDNSCYDKDIEACAVSVNIDSLKICILTIYRSPSGNYDIFFIKLELILQKLCRNNAKVFVCGDFNVNYSDNCHKKDKLDDILSSFNLRTIITFHTRIEPSSCSIIDNMFIDEQQFTSYEIISVLYGLSDHEAQLFTAPLPVLTTLKNELLIKRNINNDNIAEFKMNVSYENWESVFNNNDINSSFNQFLNILLRHFYDIISKNHKTQV
jgi:exonuclease III